MSDRKEERILRLIAQGESLDLRELELFHQWIEECYEALGFDALQKKRFDACCCSSSGSSFTKVCLGVWLLGLALEDASSSSHPISLNCEPSGLAEGDPLEGDSTAPRSSQ